MPSVGVPSDRGRATTTTPTIRESQVAGSGLRAMWLSEPITQDDMTALGDGMGRSTSAHRWRSEHVRHPVGPINSAVKARARAPCQAARCRDAIASHSASTLFAVLGITVPLENHPLGTEGRGAGPLRDGRSGRLTGISQGVSRIGPTTRN